MLDNNLPDANTTFKTINLMRLSKPILIPNQFISPDNSLILTNSDIENILKPLKLLNSSSTTPTIQIANSRSFSIANNAVFSKYFSTNIFDPNKTSTFANSSVFVTKCSINTALFSQFYTDLKITTG